MRNPIPSRREPRNKEIRRLRILRRERETPKVNNINGMVRSPISFVVLISHSGTSVFVYRKTTASKVAGMIGIVMSDFGEKLPETKAGPTVIWKTT